MTATIDAKTTKNHLNQLFRASSTRIRRCLAIKRVAYVKISSNKEDEREYGFKQLGKVLSIQIKSYERYIGKVGILNITVTSLLKQIDSLKLWEDGFFRKWMLKGSKNELEGNVALTDDKILSITKNIEYLYTNVNSQKVLFKQRMYGSEEAELRDLIEKEIAKSEELINELNGLMEIVVESINSIGVLQVKFINSLRKWKKNAASFDVGTFLDTLKERVPIFYFIKTYAIAIGFIVGFFASDEYMKVAGFIGGGTFVGIDYFADFITSLPIQRKVKNKLLAMIKKAFYSEENKHKQIAVTMIAGLEEVPSTDNL